jgi:hypothetical protein
MAGPECSGNRQQMFKIVGIGIMNKFLRMTSLAATVTALTLTATPALAVSASANPPATAQVNIVKPLTLTAQANIDFGNVVVQDNGTASIDGTTGVITCSATLTCSATGTAAVYKVTGTNNQVVNITKPNATLTNSGNPGTPLTLVLSGPATVTLPNAGATGTTFGVGGSIAIAASTKDGVYTGNLNVTVDY